MSDSQPQLPFGDSNTLDEIRRLLEAQNELLRTLVDRLSPSSPVLWTITGYDPSGDKDEYDPFADDDGPDYDDDEYDPFSDGDGDGDDEVLPDPPAWFPGQKDA